MVYQLNNMVKKARHLRDIPNIERYKFYGIQNDGTVKDCIVVKNDLGLHVVSGANFTDLIAWLPTNYLGNMDYFNSEKYTPHLLNL